MKKLMALFFVFALSLTAIYAPTASAGNSNAALETGPNSGDRFHYNPLKENKYLHDSPRSAAISGSLIAPPQYLKVDIAMFKIKTGAGDRWISISEMGETSGQFRTLARDFNASTGKIDLTYTTKTWANTNFMFDQINNKSWNLSPQPGIPVTQAWYRVHTWLGLKWVGYNI